MRARCRVRGGLRPPISQPAPQVAGRLGIDAHPLDIQDADQMLWLRSLVWPEHRDRVELLERAIALARRDPPPLARGTLPEAVAEAAASIAPDRPLVVFHSATLAYLTPEERDRFGTLLAGVARNRALAWVAFEGPGASPAAGERAQRAEIWANFGLLSLTRFDQGHRADRLLGRVEMHGRWLEWLDAASAAPPDPS